MCSSSLGSIFGSSGFAEGRRLASCIVVSSVGCDRRAKVIPPPKSKVLNAPAMRMIFFLLAEEAAEEGTASSDVAFYAKWRFCSNNTGIP